MRILRVQLSVVLVVVGAMLYGAGSAPAAPRTHAGLAGCHADSDQVSRYAVFEASMRAVPGARRMAIRFELLQRLPGQGFAPIDAPGLGVWGTAQGVGRYRYRKRVENLLAPADYRAVVSFRWLDADGGELRRARRRTPVCSQPGNGPNLRIPGIAGERTKPGLAAYRVDVYNAGITPSGDFGLSLAVDGVPLAGQPVLSLAPGETRSMSFTGPACAPAGTLQAIADPDGLVAESSEDDNVLGLPCPLKP